MRWTSSGSSFSLSAVKFARSPNMTVTCRRSPSSAARPLRIFSARWLGTSGTSASVRTLVARGFADEGSGCGASGVASWFPHAPQNRAPVETVALQRGHFNSSAVPHCSQKRAADGLLNLHDAHVIELRSPSAEPIAQTLEIIVLDVHRGRGIPALRIQWTVLRKIIQVVAKDHAL